LVILMVDVVFVTAMPMYTSLYQNKIFLMPGRYILPAISAISVLLSVGLIGPMPRRAARTLMAAVTAVMFAFALLVPFRYILPAHAEPPILSQADLPAIQNPLGINFGNKAELLGYDVGKGRVRAGEAIWIPVASDAPAPGMGRIKVALFVDDSTQEHLPVFGSQWQIADHSAVFGRIKIVPRERPEPIIENQMYYDLGGRVALIGYELSSPVDQEAGLGLKLYLQALSEMNEDYTVFVHWPDDGGQILTQ
jgi:hypothetical protein